MKDTQKVITHWFLQMHKYTFILTRHLQGDCFNIEITHVLQNRVSVWMEPHNLQFYESIFNHELTEVLELVDLSCGSFIQQMRRLFPEKPACYVALGSSCNAWLSFLLVWFSPGQNTLSNSSLGKILSLYKTGSSTLKGQTFEEGRYIPGFST